MALARVNSVALRGAKAHLIEVEVELCAGIPCFSVVGLPDASVRESRDRVRSAISSSGVQWPLRRITANLAPGGLRKAGPGFDLPLALGVLVAAGQISQEALDPYVVVGELGLDGGLRGVRGALPAAIAAREHSKAILLPKANAREASYVPDIDVVAADHLVEVMAVLAGELGAADIPLTEPSTPADHEPDLCSVKGQEGAKRALEIAAAGAHNLLLVGPPGSGKTLLARCLPSILPPLTLEESLEVSCIHSAAGKLSPDDPIVSRRPFRSPHHSASTPALVGGGARAPHPGEVSLAHEGVLFLDEMPLFSRSTLDALRQPLEDGAVTIVRSAASVAFPARFALVGAANPCPCGFAGEPRHVCTCSPAHLAGYRSRLSGPLLDRIDVRVEVPMIPAATLMSPEPGESSHNVRRRVEDARDRQIARAGARGATCNAHIPPGDLPRICALTRPARNTFYLALKKYQLSGRAHDRVLRVSRTIADLQGCDQIEEAHLLEALQYRQIVWGGAQHAD